MTNETTLNPLIESKSPAMPRHNSFIGWTTLFSIIFTVLFLIWYVFKWGGEENINLICDSAQALSSLTAFVTAWCVSRNQLLDDETKKAWQKVTLAFFAYACGQGWWFYLSSVLGEEPFPSGADIGYMAFYPLMVWALRSFPTAPQSKTDKQNFWLDASTVMISGLVVVWHFIIRPTLATGDEPLKIALNLVYVVGDMILFLGIVTILFKQPKEISRRALYAIIAGMIGISIADIGFAYLTLQNIVPTGTWSDSFFTVGSCIFVIAAYLQQKSAQQSITREISQTYQKTGFSWLPYLAVAVGYVMLLIVSKPYWSEPIGAFIIAAFLITGMVVLRQLNSVRENMRLVAEQMAQKGELKLRSLLENSSDITTIMDEKGCFEYLSPSMEKLFGYKPDQLKGTNMYKLVHPEDKSNLIRLYLENSEQFGKNFNMEYRLKHSDGSWRDIDAVGQLLRDEETQKTRVLLNARDVTARKADELRLREYTKKLQASNRELQDFAFVASHDLQEPLRKVQAFGDRLADKFSDKLGENGLDYLQRMQSASRRMQILITDLLTFSRVTTQAKPFEEYDLNKILRDVVSDMEVKIEETKAQVMVENLPTLEMDKTQMRQLFQNLIGNGLKFSKPDVSPVLKIWGETNLSADNHLRPVLFDDLANVNSEVPPGFCRIYVEDNGIGFDEKYLDRIFTVFQRLHGRAEYEGSGVGLAVCRKIVERHNGYLTAKSQPQEGAKFILTLPLSQSSQGENNENKTIDDTIS